jgi:hypothetical protein
MGVNAIDVRLSTARTGPISLRFEVSDSAGDPNPANNAAAAALEVQGPPIVRTGPTISVSPRAAVVGGGVNPQNAATSYRVEYGKTNAYGLSTAAVPAGSGSDEIAVSASLAGLEPDTTYHYRLVATSPLGEVAGAGAQLSTGRPEARLGRARLAGRFVRGAFRGRLVLSGTSAGTDRIRVRLSGPTGVALDRVRAVAGGPYSLRLPLPRTLVPGIYRAAVAPAGFGSIAAVPPQRLVLPGPPEGIVRGAFISGSLNGPPAAGTLRRPRLLFARFPFVALPRPGRPIAVQWTGPGGGGDPVRRPRLRNVASVIRPTAGGRLAAGRYVCTLRVGPAVLARVAIRVA